MKNKKILILGGAGFIGHNLAIFLNDLGAKITIVDGLQVNNLISVLSNEDKLPFPEIAKKILLERINLIQKNKINFIIQDVRDYHGLSKIFNKVKPDVVIHLAAVSHSNRSNKNPFNTFDHSLRTLENALDNARNYNEIHFIYFSSSMVYGNFTKKNVSEEDSCKPLGIYGALKYSGEKIVEAYNQVFGLKYTIIRPSALYGERCISRRVGQIFIENCLNHKSLEISGDGEEMLDFTNIKDLAEGVAKVILSKQSINQTFNLTFGKARKINELILILNDYFPKIKTKYIKKDRLMPERGTLSINKAKKLLGYKPKWDLEKGYRSYIEWYKKFIK